MSSKHIGRLAALSAAVAGLFAASGPAVAQIQERNIRASIVLAKEHSLGQAMVEVARCAADKSSGKLKIQNFFDAALGGDLPVIQQLRSGTLDIAVTSPSYFTGMAPGAALWDLPFYFANEQEAEATLDGKAGKLLAEKLSGVGVVHLTYYNVGFRHTTNSKRPVQKMEDLHGLKIRSSQSPVVLDTFKALGGFAVAMPFAEVYSALENKTIDGQENSIGLTETSKFYEVQKYLSLTQHQYGPAMMIFSKPLFDKLSPQEQAVLRDCASASRDSQRALNRKQIDESLARMKTKGLQVNQIAPAEMERMRVAAKPVQEKYLKDLGSDMTAAAQEDLQRVRGR
ncbi:DctP family TRAP transporter solute-binding subunit [Variovorax sp. KK3]|uniref:DctP family TRAP transporter solute-binding subunit n=1 Tax=Variovorax sp. KK3 TaxID=1855728 RepID=UPI00097BE983|nr:DctP family TRAP transporter solute-binding subunit [Variovorax sp. KK3]